MNGNDKIKALHDAVSKDYDVGTLEEFDKKLQDDNKRKVFYDAVSKQYDVGSYDEFTEKVKKKVSSTESSNGSQVGESETPSTGSEIKFTAVGEGERQTAAIPQAPNPFEFIENAYQRGLAQGEQAGIINVESGEINPEKIALLQKQIQANRPTEQYRKMGEAKSFGEWFDVFSKDPVRLTAELLTESTSALVRHGVTQIPEKMAMGAAGGGVMGSAIPVVGTIAGMGAGAQAGFIVGMGATSLNLEYSGKIIEGLQESGVDVTNADALKNAFSDEQKIAELKQKALQKGIPIALFDAFSAGIAGRIFKEPAKQAGKKVVQWGTELLAQSGLGGAGEAAGQIASGEELSAGAIANEMIGEFGFSPIEIATNKILDGVQKGNVTKQDFVQAHKVLKATDGKKTFTEQTELAKTLGQIDEDSKEFIDDTIEIIEQADSKVPADVLNRDEVVEKVAEKTELELQKEKVDEVFHPQIDEKIKIKEDEILQLLELQKVAETALPEAETKTEGITQNVSDVQEEKTDAPPEAEGVLKETPEVELKSEPRADATTEPVSSAVAEKKVYHGGLPLNKDEIKEDGISVTKSEEIGKYWASSRTGGKVSAYSLSPKANILTDIPKNLLPKDKPNQQDKELIVNYAKRKGFDGVDLSGIFQEEEIRIFNPDVLIEQSQTVSEGVKPEGKEVAPSEIAEKKKSILNQETDLKGESKETWMKPFDDYARGQMSRGKKLLKEEYDARIIEAAKGKYQQAISEDRMTASDAKTIIEKAGLEVPKDILGLAEKEKLPKSDKSKKGQDQERIKSVQKTSGRVKVIETPLEEINTDVDAFQNRDEEFSQESVDKIKKAVKDGTFRWEVFDPIILWRNPKDKKLYVLSGHSRTEAFRQLAEEGNKDFGTIPSKIVEGATPKEAKEIAQKSNLLATPNTLTEKINVYRGKWNEDKKTAEAEIRNNEGRGAERVINYLHLNPKGKAFTALQSLQGGEIKSENNIRTTAEYIGSVRRHYPEMSNLHEDELFDWLLKNFGKIKNRTDFHNRVTKVADYIRFNPDEPLNMDSKVTKGFNEASVESEITQARNQIKELEKERDKKKPSAARLTEISKEIAILNQKLGKLNDDLKKAKEGDKAQLDIFNQVSEEVQTKIESNEITDEEAENFIREETDRSDAKVTQESGREEKATQVTFTFLGEKLAGTLSEDGKTITGTDGKKYTVGDKQGQARISDTGAAGKGSKEYIPIGAKPTATGRIVPNPIYGKKPKTLKEIALDVSKAFGRRVFTGKTKRRGWLGHYTPKDAAIVIRYTGDLDVTAHELGHAVDDRFDLLNKITPAAKSELVPFFSKHGSTPPKGHPQPDKYILGEGIAEWFRAFIVNPSEAVIQAPEFSRIYQSAVPESAQKAVEQFSDDVRTFAGATAHDAIMSNVEWKPAEKGFLANLFKPTVLEDNFSLTVWDKLATTWTNSLRPFETAVKYAMGKRGITEMLPQDDPRIIARVFSGINVKMDNIFEKGMLDSNLKRLKDNGNAMTLQWLLEPLDNSDIKTLESESQEVITYMIAERTKELASRFDRESVLTGIGGGIFKDVDQAQKRLDEFRTQPQEKQNRIIEAARRYREMADAVLKYMTDKGRIAQRVEDADGNLVGGYEKIKEDNLQYVALRRILEISPDQEISIYSKGNGKQLGISKDVIKSIKGSTKAIQNPYASLIDFIYNGIKDADRNEVMLSFRSLFDVARNINDGEPQPLASVAREAKAGEKNTVKIFVDGKAEYWQLEKDVYEALKGINEAGYILPGFITALPRVVRWTVTNFPVFALRNRARDFQNRIVISRTGAKISDTVGKAKYKDDFEIFGGGQFGYYLMDRQDYYSKLHETMNELAKDKKFILLDPTRTKEALWDHRYKKWITASETATRLEEYKSAYRKAKKQGLDDYNANLYAAFQAKDLLDFAVAGTYMKVINQIVPFSNAAVQGLKRTIIAGKENPSGFATRWALYAVVPALLTRLLVSSMDKDEEYQKLPAYMRDLFYCIPLGDFWLTIPKPFEIGVLASSAERLLDYLYYENEQAFEGYGGSVARSVLPVDEAALAGPIQGTVSTIANYDFFRNKNIIPQYEEGVALELRKTDRASRIGKLIQDVSGIDGRKIDFWIKAHFTYYGNFALGLSDVGRPEKQGGLQLSDLGFFKESQAYSSLDVQWVMEKARERRWSSQSEYQEFERLVQYFFNATSNKERTQRGKVLMNYAENLRNVWEKRLPDE